MRLTLNLQNGANVPPLRLSGGVLPVGRNLDPFFSFEKKLVSQLSRRHARIFLQDGKFYVSDLGSRNGTFVNNNKIGENAVELHAGDSVNFGGELKFVAEIDDHEDATELLTASLSLILEPVRPDSGLDTLIVRQFPLLIGKNNEPLAQYEQPFPAELKYLSRRHALIYQNGGRVYLEDLGSTNGTYLSSERLDDVPKVLSDGSVVAFGGDFFEYRVKLSSSQMSPEDTLSQTVTDVDRTMVSSSADAHQAGEESLSGMTSPPPAGVDASAPSENSDAVASDDNQVQQSPATPEADLDPPSICKTIFVSSPSSFLEIFCEDNEDDAEDDGSSRSSKSAASDAAGGKGQAARDETSSRGRNRWIGVAAVLLVAAIGAAIWFMPSSKEQQLKTLIKEGQYEQAATLGNQWMADQTLVKSLQSLSTEAFVRHVVPAWQTAISDASFDVAESKLQTAESLVVNNGEAAAILAVLRWVTDLEKLVEQRGGEDTTIRIYQDEAAIRQIAGEWEARENENRRLLDLIPVYVPAFESLKRDVFSHVRGFLASSSIYIKAIDELSKNLSTQLWQTKDLTPDERNRRLDELDAKIEAFAKKYPKVTGVDKLRLDLTEYRKLALDIDSGDLSSVLELLDAHKPRTPPFERQRTFVTKTMLPSAEFIEGYQAAESAWASGNTVEAIEGFKQLAKRDWNATAASRLEHYQQLVERYAELSKLKGKDGYRPALLSFYRQLGDNDGFFKQQLSKDFENVKASITRDADAAFLAASKNWNTYREQGGIDGGMRVNRRILPSYQRQTERLSDAMRQVTIGSEAYKTLAESPDARWQDLKREIRFEIIRQRQWLNDVRPVVGPKITQRKLDMLPESIASGDNE